MGLGAASVKAQVRIGGNGSPNAAAVLDLNADDATTGTKGLALPRVALTSNTMLLPGVTTNLTGMLVYNTTTTLGAAGIYYWNGERWVIASLPAALPTDSGKSLQWDGSKWIMQWPIASRMFPDTIALLKQPVNISWLKTVDTTWQVSFNEGQHIMNIYIPGLSFASVCVTYANYNPNIMEILNNWVYVQFLNPAAGTTLLTLRCYSASN